MKKNVFVLVALLLVIFVLCGIVANAQSKILTYSGTFYSMENEPTILKKVVINDKKGMSFRNAHFAMNLKDGKTYFESNSKSFPVTLFDKGKFVESRYCYDSVKNEGYFVKSSPKWASIKDEVSSKDYKKWTKKYNDVLPSDCDRERNFKLKLTKETQTINGYECKLANVSEFGKDYKVWYTEEMSYNHLSLSFVYEIPGTVVKIEQDGKVVLELLKVEDFDYANVPFKADEFSKLMGEW